MESFKEEKMSQNLKYKKVGNYVLASTIGKGTFGKVKLGIHLPTTQKVAIKILDKEKIKECSDQERVHREISILKHLHHPNLVQLYETVSSERNIYLIMSLAEGGDLFKYISKHNRLNESKSADIFHQIILALEYIHSMGIAHRDLKPENILLDSKYEKIKIVDFGLSNVYSKDQLLTTSCGSPCYAAPEMISGKAYNGLKSDLWSAGVVLFCMLTGFLPFDDENIHKLYKKISCADFNIPSSLSSEAKDLIKNILKVDVTKRYGIEEIKNHPWISDKFSKDELISFTQSTVDEDVVQQVKNMPCHITEEHITLDFIKESLIQNLHNNLCTSYFLLKDSKKRENFQIHQNKEKSRQDFNLNNLSNINNLKNPEGRDTSNTEDHSNVSFYVINNFIGDYTKNKAIAIDKLKNKLTDLKKMNISLKQKSPLINKKIKLNLNSNLNNSLHKDRTFFQNNNHSINQNNNQSINKKKSISPKKNLNLSFNLKLSQEKQIKKPDSLTKGIKYYKINIVDKQKLKDKIIKSNIYNINHRNFSSHNKENTRSNSKQTSQNKNRYITTSVESSFSNLPIREVTSPTQNKISDKINAPTNFQKFKIINENLLKNKLVKRLNDSISNSKNESSIMKKDSSLNYSRKNESIVNDYSSYCGKILNKTRNENRSPSNSPNLSKLIINGTKNNCNISLNTNNKKHSVHKISKLIPEKKIITNIKEITNKNNNKNILTNINNSKISQPVKICFKPIFLRSYLKENKTPTQKVKIHNQSFNLSNIKSLD